MDNLPQGTLVDFKIDPVEGTGRICGISNTGLPVLGVGYIVEVIDAKNLGHKVYPYTHLVVFACNLKVK